MSSLVANHGVNFANTDIEMFTSEEGVARRWKLTPQEIQFIDLKLTAFASWTETSPCLTMYVGLTPTKQLCLLQPDEWEKEKINFARSGGRTIELSVQGYSAQKPHLLKINGIDFEITYFAVQDDDCNHPTAHMLPGLLTGTQFFGNYWFMYARLKRHITTVETNTVFLDGSFADALRKNLCKKCSTTNPSAEPLRKRKKTKKKKR